MEKLKKDRTLCGSLNRKVKGSSHGLEEASRRFFLKGEGIMIILLWLLFAIGCCFAAGVLALIVLENINYKKTRFYGCAVRPDKEGEL